MQAPLDVWGGNPSHRADVWGGNPSLSYGLATGASPGFEDSASAILSTGHDPYRLTQSQAL